MLRSEIEAADPVDFLIVGAGPAGLACAVDLSLLQQDTRVIDRGCIADSVYRFPDGMQFFSDAKSLEFAGYQMPSKRARPTRNEAIRYYRRVVQDAGIDVRQRETVLSIDGRKGDFAVRTSRTTHRTRHVVIATGFYGEPNLLGIPGESLGKVAHYFRDAHPYYGQDVAVVGGRNSAGIVALELVEAGARVTLIHRGGRFGMKPWIGSALHAAIEGGAIRAIVNAQVLAIEPESVLVGTAGVELEIANDYVFAMTGYRPDFDFLKRNELPLSPCGTRPLCDPKTLESGRPGVYFSGAVMAGLDTHAITIENSRHHGAKIAAAVLGGGRDLQVGEMRPCYHLP